MVACMATPRSKHARSGGGGDREDVASVAMVQQRPARECPSGGACGEQRGRAAAGGQRRRGGVVGDGDGARLGETGRLALLGGRARRPLPWATALPRPANGTAPNTAPATHPCRMPPARPRAPQTAQPWHNKPRSASAARESPPAMSDVDPDDTLHLEHLVVDDPPDEPIPDAPPLAASASRTPHLDAGAREAALRAELVGVQQVNAVIESVNASLASAQQNMEVGHLLPTMHFRSHHR